MASSSVPDTPENRKVCLCPRCPSYPPGNDPKDILYCSIGASRREIFPRGCLCPGCRVYLDYHLDRIYYCTKASLSGSDLIIRRQSDRENDELYQTIGDIKKIATTGTSIISAMGSLRTLPYSFHDLHFIPAQVHRIPLNREEMVRTEVVLGPQAKRPLRAPSPIIVSGLSYGAVSRNVKEAIAGASARGGFLFNSGEGGVLPEELATASAHLIAQYSTGRFGVNDNVLKKAAAIEIRFGQGAYPGKGSFLPAKKITPEIAEIRGLKSGENSYSPAHHPDITRPEEIREKVDWLRTLTGGVPVGAKIGCGAIEKDCEVLMNAGVDFIAIDGFGGGTGATTYAVRENVGIPLIAALPRADRFLRIRGVREDITLIAGGGLRTSGDFSKCLALGADAVYTGTAALIAINCEQYRICNTGNCPTGVTTQKPMLTGQLKVEEGIFRLQNFIKVCTEEIAEFVRIVGKNDISLLKMTDLVSLNRDLAEITGCRWVGEPSS